MTVVTRSYFVDHARPREHAHREAAIRDHADGDRQPLSISGDKARADRCGQLELARCVASII